ncbi:MAG: divalent cation transporter [Pirellulaceae bacterium]|nr:MAG: divalent cation transporter [Pirellulaceae bacterium]
MLEVNRENSLALREPPGVAPPVFCDGRQWSANNALDSQQAMKGLAVSHAPESPVHPAIAGSKATSTVTLAQVLPTNGSPSPTTELGVVQASHHLASTPQEPPNPQQEILQTVHLNRQHDATAIPATAADFGGEPARDVSLDDATATVREESYNLQQLEQLALQHNPAYCEAVARYQALQGQWIQVGLPPNPILGYSGQQLGSSGQAEQQGVYVEQEIITGKKLQLNRQILGWQVQRARSEMEQVRQQILTDVQTAYIQVLIAQNRRHLAQTLVDLTRQSLLQAEALYAAKEVSQADPLRAQIAVSQAQVVLQNAVNQHLAAWRRLAAVTGQADLPLSDVTGDFHPDDYALEWETELARLQQQSPEIAAAIAELEAARWAVRRAHAQVIPDINVQGIVQDDRATGSSNGNLQVTLPIPIWNRNQGGIRQARATATAAQRRVDRLLLDLQARLADEFQSYQNARNEVEQYGKEGGILSQSQRSVELLRQAYQAGEVSLIDLLSAQQQYLQNSLDYLDAAARMASSAIRIRGLLLDKSLSNSPGER